MTNVELCDISSSLLMAICRKLPATELVAALTEGIVMIKSYRVSIKDLTDLQIKTVTEIMTQIKKTTKVINTQQEKR